MEPPCGDATGSFRGYITGHGNLIPGPGDPDENSAGAVCPTTLGFLMTENGGQLDRRR